MGGLADQGGGHFLCGTRMEGPSCHTEHPAWGWRLGSGLPASAALKEERKRQEGLRHPVPPVPMQQHDSRGELAAPPPSRPLPPARPPEGQGGVATVPKPSPATATARQAPSPRFITQRCAHTRQGLTCFLLWPKNVSGRCHLYLLSAGQQVPHVV